jgi:two-component system cell cycle sensor histidine kinase/response regulator CckA
MRLRFQPPHDCGLLVPPALGVGSAALGMLALAGWLVGGSWLLSLRPHYIPVAPNTAVSLALLGLALATRSPTRHPLKAPAIAAAALTLAFASGRLVEAVLGRSLGVDGVLLPLVPARAPAGMMAVPTAVGLLLAGSGVLLLAGEGVALRVASTLGVCVGGLGLAFTLGYVYGAPLMYGTGAVPVALGTAVGLLCLGTSIAAHAGLRRAVHRRRRRIELRETHAELRRAHTRLGTLNQELEARVRSRTAELERAYVELSASERELQTLFEAMTDIIIVMDRDGRYRKVAPTNPPRRLGPPHEMVGRTLHDVVPAPLADACLAKVREALDGGRSVTTEYTLNVDGEEVAYFATVVPLSDELATWIARDVTDQRRAEAALRESQDQLRHAQKMEALGRLAGGVAHDFNNLLTAIKGTAQLLLQDLPPHGSHHDDVQEIDRAATRAAALTGQLLLFSRKQAVRLRPVDLNALVAGAEKLLRRVIGEDVELTVTLGDGAGVIEADPGQMEQVVMNLALNARDAMPSGGRMEIATRSAPPRGPEDPPAGHAVLAVRDTGTGMDEATRDRVFEPFFTTKAEGRGTGLGLSTVYGIVQQAGGRIDLHTRPGEGTTFEIFLPRGSGTGQDGEVDAPRASGRRNGTVLVVEDEDPVRNVARRVLQRAGYRVLEARTGEEGVRLCREGAHEIDLVLTDVVMPDMSGWRLAALVRETCPGKPILFTSGYTDHAVLRHGPATLGANFIAKPFSPDALLAKVDELVLGGARPDA